MEKALQEKGTFDASYKEIEQKIKETKSKLEALNIALQKTNTDEPIPDSVIAEAKTYYQQLSESFQKENDEFTSKIKKNGNLISLLLANIEHIKKIPLLSAKEKELKDKQLQFERMKRHFANPAFSKDKVLKQMQDFVSQHQEQLSKLKTGEYQKEYASRPTSVTEEKDAQRKREDAQKQALELFSEQPDVTRSRNEFLKSSAYTTLLNKEQVSDNEVQKYTIDFVLEIMKTHFNKEQTKLPATVSLRHGLKINLLPSQTRLDIYKKYCDLSTAGSTILAINFKNQEQLTFSALNDVLCKLISEIDMSKPAGSDSELAGVLLQAQVAALTRHTKFLDGIIKELTDNSKKMQSLFADILAKAQEANKIVIGSGVALQSVIPGLQANIITINGLKTKLSEIENETKMYAIATPAEDIPLFAEIKGAENAINTKTTAINTTLQTMKKEIKEQTEKYQKALDGTKEYLEKRLEELSIEINNWTQEDKLALKLISVELMQKSDSLIKEQQDIVASLNEKNTQLTELLNKEPRDQKKLEEIKQSIEQDTKNLAQSNEQILAMQKEIQAQEKASYESNKLKLDDKKTKLETERQKVQTLLQEIAPLLSEEERERHNGQMDLYLETIQENAAQIETLHKDATSKLEGQIIQQNEIIKKANDAVADTKRKLTAIAENEQKVKAVITEVQKDLKKASDDLATIKVDASIGSDLAKEMIGKTNVPAEIDIYRPAIDDVLKYLRDQKTKDSTSAEKKAVAIEALLHDPHTTFQQIRVAAARFRTGGAVTVFFRDLFGIKTTSSKLLEKGIEEINKKRPKVTHDANWEQKRGATVKAIVDLQAEFKAKQTAHTSSLAFLQGMLQSAGKKEGVATGRVQQTEKYLQQDLAQAELSVLEKFKVLLQFGRDLEIKSDQAEEAGEKKENQLYELQAFKAFSEKMLSTIDNANTSFKKLQDQSNSLKDNLSALLAKVSMCEEFDYLNLKDAIDTNLSSIETGMDANDSDYKSLKIILASALIECAPLLISLQKLFEIDEPSLLTRFTNFFNITQPDKAKETALQEVRTAKSEIETTAGNMLRSVDPNFNLALVKVDNSENIKHLRIAIDSLKSRVRSESAAASASTDERLRKLRIAAGYGRGGEHAAPIEKEEQQQVQVVVSRPPSPPPSPKPSRDEPEAGPGPSGPSSSATPPPGEH